MAAAGEEPRPLPASPGEPRACAHPTHTHLLCHGLARRQGGRREHRGAPRAAELWEGVGDGRQRRGSELRVFILKAPAGECEKGAVRAALARGSAPLFRGGARGRRARGDPAHAACGAPGTSGGSTGGPWVRRAGWEAVEPGLSQATSLPQAPEAWAQAHPRGLQDGVRGSRWAAKLRRGRSHGRT